MKIRVIVAGAAGRMGREVVRAVSEAEGMELVAAIDTHLVGQDAGVLAGVGELGIPIQDSLQAALTWDRQPPEVLVDFTVPSSVRNNIETALKSGVSPVVGTTGLSAGDLREIDVLAQGIGAFLAPNFAIGAVLMMQFAAQAAKYLPDVEIIELHHEKKVDSPSGTALLTAQKIAQARKEAHAAPKSLPFDLIEKAPGARGARNEITGDVPIHSVRLPGFVAHQEVIFGGTGEILTLRHDSTERRSFMPGVLLAIRKVRSLSGLIVGLENLL